MKTSLMNAGLVIGFLCSACFLSAVFAAEPEKGKHSIQLSVDNGPFTFGRPVSLLVSYRNGDEVAWLIPSPPESTSCYVYYRPSKSNKRPQGYSLGREIALTRTMPNGKSYTAIEEPKTSQISIAPMQTHEFSIQFREPRDWQTDVLPGNWTIWMRDENFELESNSIDISLRFTVDSVLACLEIAGDEKETIHKRAWHAQWLQRFDSGLKLTWPGKDITDEVKAKLEVGIEAELQEFAEYWETAKTTRRVARIVAEINREAGLEPEADAAE